MPVVVTYMVPVVTQRGACLDMMYSMAMVGASNAHSLLTVSTDGRMCLWNTSALVDPVVSACCRANET